MTPVGVVSAPPCSPALPVVTSPRSAMIRLYQGSGSGEIQLVGSPTPGDEWLDLRRSACRLLRVRGAERAADLLESVPFDLHEATNTFGDEFSVLHLSASLDQYVELGAQAENPSDKQAYAAVANTLTEIGLYIRFIAVSLDTRCAPEPVSSPSLAITSDTVERALADCEHLLHGQGATSGVDRVHTAFHGYLRKVCTQAGLAAAENAGVTQLFKLLREQHPSFRDSGPRAEDVDRVARSMATIVDSLNPLRNQATLAHPNEAVLEEPEAMLVINAVRTLLHYLNSKLA
jgi:abortive infection Abi-like protein